MSQTRRNFFNHSVKAALGLSIGSSVLPFTANAFVDVEKKVKKIPTVTGTVDSDQLGTTLIHEHVLFGEIAKDKEQESIDFAVAMLLDAVRVGIDTIVDLSPTRNIRLYQAIAARVPINIIVSTGSYIQRLMPEYLVKMSEKEFKDHIRQELTEGIQGTKVRAGIIKVAGNKTPLTTWEQKKIQGGS